VGTPQPNHQSIVKFPSFWTKDPVSWFCLVEGKFTLHNMVDPVARYYHVLSALSQDAVQLVRYVLHEEKGLDSYNNLRTSLLVSHSLFNYLKMERMMKLPPLLYLQRLPQEIHVLLSEDDPADMQAIVEKADRLIAMHVPQGHDACAAVSAD
jgi:hypothetical protein